ncbi:HNH endonuclease [Blastococcus deserti]|uniref:DUF222 domain-containing protein n=1 Tax=Blastococcus deserti TaxID=2259033 RepID=A0ABW4XDP1_9ACTN
MGRCRGRAAVGLDALAAEDLHALVGPQLLDRTAELVAARNRIDAELTRTVRAADLARAAEHDGLESMKPWLRSHVRLSAGEIARLVRHGRALEQLPALAAAFSAGAVSAEQVAVTTPVVSAERVAAAAGQGVDLAAVDDALATVAAGAPFDRLRRLVQHYLACLDLDGTEPDPTEHRSLTLAKHADGTVSGRFELDAVGGEKPAAALESFVQADRPSGDLRTRAQQLGDALVQAADNALAAGGLPTLRTVKPHVIVRIDLPDLVDPALGPGAGTTGFGATGFGATVSAARARWLACDGNISRVVFGPEGTPLDLGRTHRVVPPHLRRAVELRDRGCVFAGCAAPTHWCDVHHLLHWIDGGETSLANAALLCERHHTKVRHGFRVQRDPGGRWRTFRPDDTEILIAEPVLAVR